MRRFFSFTSRTSRLYCCVGMILAAGLAAPAFSQALEDNADISRLRELMKQQPSEVSAQFEALLNALVGMNSADTNASENLEGEGQPFSTPFDADPQSYSSSDQADQPPLPSDDAQYGLQTTEEPGGNQIETLTVDGFDSSGNNGGPRLDDGVMQDGIGINAANAANIVDKSRPFSAYTWLTAHNAYYNGSAYGVPSQELSITGLLNSGVRGLMLDTHNDPVELCHEWDCRYPFWYALRDVANFLANNREAVVTILLEDYAQRTALQTALNQASAVQQYVFNPTEWSGRSEWPSLQEMINQNQRLILMTSKSGNSGTYNNGVYMFYDQHINVENDWRLGTTIGSHDLSCKSRWSGSLSEKTTQHSEFRGWSRLFVMNHFHAAALAAHSDGVDNELGGQPGSKSYNGIYNRVVEHCQPAAGRAPNYIALDFAEKGDAIEYVELLNNGGVVAFEGNSATQDIVCAIPTGTARGFTLQASDQARLGCENDEMRSLISVNAKPGTRITLYDHPSGSRDDDYAIIDVLTPGAAVSTFEADWFGIASTVRYSGGNGLDGKVSYVKIEPNPVRYSEAAIVLLRGDNYTQRISCSFGLNSSNFWNLKNTGGCHNDDARSAKIMAAQAGTVITIYDSPSGSTGDDYVTLTIKRSFDKPRYIPHFETSWEDDYIKSVFRRHNGLNGKVSAVRVSR